MLTYGDLKADLFRMCGVLSTTTRTDITQAVTSAVRRAGEFFCNYAAWGFLEQLQDTVYIPLAAPYATGTVTVTQDSPTVSGSGTTFTKDMEGDFLVVNDGEPYEIRTFNTTISLSLAINYQNTSAAAQSFAIYKRFYPLPLNMLRPIARDSKIVTPGSNNQSPLVWHRDPSFADNIVKGKPEWFGIVNNTRVSDFYNTSTVTISTSSGISTWATASGTLPDPIANREVRIRGESRAYRIRTRVNGADFTTLETYVNPVTGLNTQLTASNYAITPKESKQVSFYPLADQRYVAAIPYIKGVDEMILDTDISPIVLAGYEGAFLGLCRELLARDGRTAMRGDMVASLVQASAIAMAEAWQSEQQQEAMKWEGSHRRQNRTIVGPSWISR